MVKHLSEGELDRLQAEADEIKEYKRLTFLKRLYDGATLAAATEDVGISQATASNWVTRWSAGAHLELIAVTMVRDVCDVDRHV